MEPDASWVCHYRQKRCQTTGGGPNATATLTSTAGAATDDRKRLREERIQSVSKMLVQGCVNSRRGITQPRTNFVEGLYEEETEKVPRRGRVLLQRIKKIALLSPSFDILYVLERQGGCKT